MMRAGHRSMTTMDIKKTITLQKPHERPTPTCRLAPIFTKDAAAMVEVFIGVEAAALVAVWVPEVVVQADSAAAEDVAAVKRLRIQIGRRIDLINKMEPKDLVGIISHHSSRLIMDRVSVNSRFFYVYKKKS